MTERASSPSLAEIAELLRGLTIHHGARCARLSRGSECDCGADEKEARRVAAASALRSLAEVMAGHEAIFRWLLGEDGDFPESQPGRRYGFRTELRARLRSVGTPTEEQRDGNV